MRLYQKKNHFIVAEYGGNRVGAKCTRRWAVGRFIATSHLKKSRSKSIAKAQSSFIEKILLSVMIFGKPCVMRILGMMV